MNLVHSQELSYALTDDEPAVIAVGNGDDALYYCTYLAPCKETNSFYVELAYNSLLLDSLRFKRELSCSVSFHEGRIFQATLVLHGSRVIVKIYEECCNDNVKDALVPRT